VKKVINVKVKFNFVVYLSLVLLNVLCILVWCPWVKRKALLN